MITIVGISDQLRAESVINIVGIRNRWVAQPKESRDSPVRNSGDEMVNLVRNAYRVLLTRGIRETRVLCLDPETRDHLADLAAGGKTS